MDRHAQRREGHDRPQKGVTILLWMLSMACCLGLREEQANNASARAVEITTTTADLLPAGKEADGIIGVFVLRNERIHAVVSANLPARKTNYATQRGYITPGCLYDLDLVGDGNDQLTIFRPGGLGGMLSYVRVITDLNQGTAAVEVVRTAAMGNQVLDEFLREIRSELHAKRLMPAEGADNEAALRHVDTGQLSKPFREKLQYLQTVSRNLSMRHEYRLESGWQHLIINSTYRNEGTTTIRFSAGPIWNEFPTQWRVGEI